MLLRWVTWTGCVLICIDLNQETTLNQSSRRHRMSLPWCQECWSTEAWPGRMDNLVICETLLRLCLSTLTRYPALKDNEMERNERCVGLGIPNRNTLVPFSLLGCFCWPSQKVFFKLILLYYIYIYVSKQICVRKEDDGWMKTAPQGWDPAILQKI